MDPVLKEKVPNPHIEEIPLPSQSSRVKLTKPAPSKPTHSTCSNSELVQRRGFITLDVHVIEANAL